MEQKKIFIKNEKDSMEFGKLLSRKLTAGSVIALTGDLGTGKTTLTKAVAEGLGIKETITSPTFNIVKQYDSGRLPLYHFDVYRIGDEDEMFDIGFDEYVDGDGVCLIEWAELIKGIIPENAVSIKITKDLSKGLDYRKIEVEE